MIPQEYNGLQWVIIGTTALWVLDILYRNVVEKKDAYRYILISTTLISITLLPSKWQMGYILCRYWYSSLRLGFRIGLLYNVHAVMFIMYVCHLSQQESEPVIRTWHVVFSLIDMILVTRGVRRPLKLFLWGTVRIIGFGVYTLFFTESNFLKVYFGALWMTQLLMVRQLT